MILALVVQIAPLHPTMMTVTYRILTKAVSRLAQMTRAQHPQVLTTTNFRLLLVFMWNNYRNISGLVENLCLPSMIVPLLLLLSLYRKCPPLETQVTLLFHRLRPRRPRLRLHRHRLLRPRPHQHHPPLVLARYHFLFPRSRPLRLRLLSLAPTLILHQILRAHRSSELTSMLYVKSWH